MYNKEDENKLRKKVWLSYFVFSCSWLLVDLRYLYTSVIWNYLVERRVAGISLGSDHDE